MLVFALQPKFPDVLESTSHFFSELLHSTGLLLLVAFTVFYLYFLYQTLRRLQAKRRCPVCAANSEIHRTKRPWPLRFLFPFFPAKAYRCNKCRRIFYYFKGKYIFNRMGERQHQKSVG